VNESHANGSCRVVRSRDRFFRSSVPEQQRSPRRLEMTRSPRTGHYDPQQLDSWIAIHSDNTASVKLGRVWFA